MSRRCHSLLGCPGVAVLLFACACSKSPAPAPPAVTPPTTSETINGTERIGWTEAASDAVELATVRYAIYVDGTRSELSGVTCDTTASTDGFACSARLPALTAGAHTLELASFVNDGTLLESARSPALHVTVTATVAERLPSRPSGESTAWPANAVVAIDDVRLRIELVADNLNQPTDLAFAPDGRLFIAEQQGTIRTLRGTALSAPEQVLDRPAADERLLAIALDPDFTRTRFVFVVTVANGTFALSRAREVSDTLGDRAVLLDSISATSSAPSAALRFGPDGKLYAAFDEGTDPRLAASASALNGKVLRLNADGTTPDDQAGASPRFASPLRSPGGLAWQPETGAMWMADRADATIVPVVSAAAAGESRVRGVLQQRWPLPAASPPAGVAFAKGSLIPALNGSLLVASREGRQLLRVRFDPLNPARVAAMDSLLHDLVGSIGAVAAGPDGAVYFATPRSVGRLVPE